MIDIEKLRQDPDLYKSSMQKRGLSDALIDEVLKIDLTWRNQIQVVEQLKAKQKEFSKERNIEKAKEVKEELSPKEEKLKEIEKERKTLLLQVPNLVLESVPEGKSDRDNVTVSTWSEPTKFSFKAKEHHELGERLSMIDTARAAKVSGSRFSYLLSDVAKLEFALIQCALDLLTQEKFIKKALKKAGVELSSTPFTPVIPPVLVKEEMMQAMGYTERGVEEIYKTAEDTLYLVGTSEQSVGPMHAGETFKAQDLPRRYLSFSSCFRREAGTYGKDMKGIFRLHQFDKLEMFSISTQENSDKEHKFLLAVEELLMQKLDLPYRVLNICSADLGDPAAAKYDIEAWMPGQNEGRGQYRETHSTSNTTDFQSRRLGIKYQDEKGLHVAHLLNGTAFSMRPLIAIMENYQTEEGNIRVPKVLQKYLGKKVIQI
ncbi:MAG: serine--tRNA ligase [Candidatus Harrisonbacteria bacterium]|nr:serine--tRNA ligase [Candidatus Harrisonbacteria bacterium]